MEAFITKIIKSYGKKEIRIHSSSAAFYIVVSALPLVAILSLAISYFSPELMKEFESLLQSILPKEFYSEAYNIIVRMRENLFPALVPFTVIAALWGSTKGVYGLCYGIERIYEMKKQPRLILRWIKTAWRTILFYLVVVTSLLIFALGKLVTAQSVFLEIIINLRVIIFATLLSLIFALFYSRLANTPFKNHIVGGIFSSVGWMLFTYFYSMYVSFALKSASVYAEMGTVIFFMLWVYFCVNIILIGAEINHAL